jgi:hypothetical protein
VLQIIGRADQQADAKVIRCRGSGFEPRQSPIVERRRDIVAANPAQATVATMPAFSGGDGAITVQASPQPVAPALTMERSAELLDFAPQTDLDYAEIFDFDRDLIIEPMAGADVAQIALTAARNNPPPVGRNLRFEDAATIDLATNGLGRTALVKHGSFSLGNGFDFGILRVFLLIFVTVLIAFVVVRWKLT